MQTFKKRKTVCHDLQSLITFAEKQRVIELEGFFKKVQKHGLCQQGRAGEPLLEDLGTDPLRHPAKSTSGISSVVSQNPKKNTKQELEKKCTLSQSRKNQQYNIPPRIQSTFGFHSLKDRRSKNPEAGNPRKKEVGGKKASLSGWRRVGSGGKGSHSLTFKTVREKRTEEQKQKPFER